MSEPSEFLSVNGLGHAVSFHLISWTVLNVNVDLGFLISDEEESNVEMPGSFSSTLCDHFLPGA